jgi:hypothetical protein
MLKIIAVAVALLPSLAFAQDYEAQARRINAFFSQGKAGHSSDYYLVKDGGAGMERVAIIYGLADDKSFCQDIADAYMRRYPVERFLCEKANK